MFLNRSNYCIIISFIILFTVPAKNQSCATLPYITYHSSIEKQEIYNKCNESPYDIPVEPPAILLRLSGLDYLDIVR